MPTEAQTQRDLLLAIGSIRGLHVERTNTGLATDTRTGRSVRFGVPGAPDVRVCMAGRAVAIEVKSPTGGQSERQRRWQAAHEAAGGVYLLCRDAGETVRDLAMLARMWGRPELAVALEARAATAVCATRATVRSGG
jgi:hypothetical protein